MKRLLAPLVAAIGSFNLRCITNESLFWERWMRNTMRNVTMVVPVPVPVLMTSYQFSE